MYKFAYLKNKLVAFYHVYLLVFNISGEFYYKPVEEFFQKKGCLRF